MQPFKMEGFRLYNTGISGIGSAICICQPAIHQRWNMLLNIIAIFFILIILGSLTQCRSAYQNNDDLILFNDTLQDRYGYKNQNGDIVIPIDKYLRCFTDTFKTYAIVIKEHTGFVAIDRQENVLYKVFPFDNGPDEPSEGLFRILSDKKIGYADSLTGKVVIKPQFDCAWPFENGMAKVSTDCTTQTDGEHSIWSSDNWFYIDRRGKKITDPIILFHK